MKDILGVRRLNTVLVPKDLTFDQKNARKETASLNLEATTDDPELLKRVITGDETWIYGFDSKTTQQASEWRFKNEPRPKKARKAQSKVEVMLTVFFDYQGIVVEFQQQGSTITADSYLGVLRRLKEAIRQKRPELWRSKTDENVQKITDLIKENPRTTLLELEQDTGISKTTIGRIVTEDLKLIKTPAKFIPRFLTNEQKLCRLATCEDMLEMTRTDPEWKDKIITGDETWVYGYDPETKRQSAEWRGQGEPRPKKSRILKSRNKVLMVAFLDNKGIVHHEYLPAGQTVINEMYLGILCRLREAIRKKRPEKWTNGDWILHHDNARPHTAHLVTSILAKNGTQILPQPSYFPDIAPNNFFLSPKLKAVLKGRHFDTRNDIIEKPLLALKRIPKEAYKNCFDLPSAIRPVPHSDDLPVPQHSENVTFNDDD
ncbi:hypothetical protein LAZ67_2005793 [Cordylochernes scorpioides]|uniref:Transposase n=1 Tax=Cordylochernes scorpioides TaxID=51811 RepID=A0ABY6K812_9ARAC|nr:hypothetical protein LAZ67_2005793 [Cordylochernes scorpioides]